MYVCMYVCAYVYPYVHMYVYACTYIHAPCSQSCMCVHVNSYVGVNRYALRHICTDVHGWCTCYATRRYGDIYTCPTCTCVQRVCLYVNTCIQRMSDVQGSRVRVLGKPWEVCDHRNRGGVGRAWSNYDRGTAANAK